jgi:hypothetical protein
MPERSGDFVRSGDQRDKFFDVVQLVVLSRPHRATCGPGLDESSSEIQECFAVGLTPSARMSSNSGRTASNSYTGAIERGSRFQVPGSRFKGSRVQGFKGSRVQRWGFMESRARRGANPNLEPGTWNLEPGTWSVIETEFVSSAADPLFIDYRFAVPIVSCRSGCHTTARPFTGTPIAVESSQVGPRRLSKHA